MEGGGGPVIAADGIDLVGGAVDSQSTFWGTSGPGGGGGCYQLPTPVDNAP